ncbi:MAG: sigma-54 interaction domain-containing protein [Anaerovoracaceae bacterium]
MIEQYLNQILTMNVLADSICIIDDKGIIRYFKSYNNIAVPFFSKDIIGKHFLKVFTNINPSESTVLKALNGESFYNSKGEYIDAYGNMSETFESVYPIILDRAVIGVVIISRRITSAGCSITLSPLTMDSSEDFSDIISVSPSMEYLKRQIKDVSNSNINVMIYGETGTGKELVARAIHRLSRRSDKPFYSQNCAAIPEQLLESLFFGTTKGIYTGATERTGILAQADGGTLFLDEVNSLSISIQSKLLKAIEEKKFRPLGSKTETNADFRMISATNENPFQCVRDQKLRSDFFFRLSTIILEIPPLRKRKEDIPELIKYFIEKYNENGEFYIEDISDDAMETLIEYDWPGNVRELKNVLAGSMVFSHDSIIRKENLPAYLLDESTAGTVHNFPAMNYNASILPPGIPTESSSGNFSESLWLNGTMEQIEAEVLRKHLATDESHAEIARKLGISRQTVIAKIKKYGL